MSDYQFRPAKRSEAKPLIGLYSESGCGKTWSSLLLARGFVGPTGRIGMIETESGRGEIYVGVAPVGEYLVCPVRNDFSPAEFGKAITAAEGAELDALIIDSASHEWEGVGGVLSMAADNQAANKRGPLVWQKPKMDHARHFVLRLMQTPIPLVIVNMRAKYPMKEQKNSKGEKEWIRSDQLEPKQSDDILFEMMCHGWIDKEHALHVTKYPQAVPEWKNIIVDGQPLTADTGQRLRLWAAGGTPKQDAPSTRAPADTGTAGAPAQPDTLSQINTTLGFASETLKKRYTARLLAGGVKSTEELSDDDKRKALDWLKAQIDRESATTTS